MNKIYAISLSIVVFIIMILYLVLYCFFGINNDSMENFIISLMTNLIVLIATVFILERVFSTHHERINKEAEMQDYKDVLRRRHHALVFSLESFLIAFITKKPADYEHQNEKEVHVLSMNELKEHVESYVCTDFFRKKHTVLIIDSVNPFNHQEVSIGHTEFLLEYKNRLWPQVSDYILLYSKIIPNEILKVIIDIERHLKTNNLFLIPEEKGLAINMNRIDIKEEDLESVKNELLNLIEIVEELKDSVE